MRFAACCHTSDCGPSITSSVTSSPRCAGRQCRNTASGVAAAMSAASTVQPSNAASRRARSASWPIDVHVSV
jgi:hypothetical protein